MNTEHTDQSVLRELLRKARSRRQLLLSLRGAAITVGVIAVVLLLTGWTAHRYRYNASALIVLRIGALLTVLATFYFALLRPLLKRITDTRLARLIEEKSPGIEDRLVTAVEYSNERTGARFTGARQPSLSRRKQRFRDARRPQHHSTFTSVALRRRSARESAFVRRRFEMGTARDLGRRRAARHADRRSLHRQTR